MQKHFLLILLALFSLPAKSSSLKEFSEEVSSPVSTDAKYVLYAGVAVAGVLTLYRSQIVKPFQTTQVKTHPLGSTSVYGDMLGQLVPNILYVGGMGYAAYKGNKRAGERAVGMFKATTYASLATTALKYTIRSPRPYNSNIRNSFPSGHTTTAFAFSGYVAAEHGWKWGLPALAMSSFVGYSRINDNRHWLNDVAAGATIGWMYGWGMARVDQRRRAEREKQKNNIFPQVPDEKEDKKDEDLDLPPVVVPLASSNSVGVGIYKEF